MFLVKNVYDRTLYLNPYLPYTREERRIISEIWAKGEREAIPREIVIAEIKRTIGKG